MFVRPPTCFISEIIELISVQFDIMGLHKKCRLMDEFNFGSHRFSVAPSVLETQIELYQFSQNISSYKN
jgi:hypothetical protein